MKAFWQYRCDYGHIWTVLRDEDAPESPDDAVCPHAHPHDDELIPSGRKAITRSIERLVDAVQVAIRPGARIVDPVKNQVAHDYEFFLVVNDLHSGTERQSVKSFTWAQAKEVLDQFRNLPANRAWQLLDRLDSE